VEGFPEKQWLYIVCPKCLLQWGFNHLGVTREGDTKDGAPERGTCPCQCYGGYCARK
jgi:hypothetical protein